MHRVREHTIPLPHSDSAPDLTVLHISDLHLLPRLRARRRFVASLADRVRPDLVIYTGDTISSADAVQPALDALDGLLDAPGVFVFGSNDYMAPVPKSPVRYFTKKLEITENQTPLPAESLAAALAARGWTDLRNARTVLEVAGRTVSVVGVDDPHVERDRLPEDDGLRGDLHLGVAHAPYSRILDAFHAEGADMAFFGHTHGGQVCVPHVGALVTNSDIPPWRASGLQGWPGRRPDGVAIVPRRAFQPVPANLPENSPEGPRPMWVNISAGLGTSPFTPVRYACPPEVSVLRFAHYWDFNPAPQVG